MVFGKPFRTFAESDNRGMSREGLMDIGLFTVVYRRTFGSKGPLSLLVSEKGTHDRVLCLSYHFRCTRVVRGI